MRISAILCTFNRQDFLDEALGSIFAQTLPPAEVIVVDDGSTDDTPDRVARRYGDRIRLIRRETNSRTCERPRYDGAKAATSDWCAFLDSDDLWAPEKLERQARFLTAHPDIPLCHTYARIIDDAGRPQGIRHEGAVPATGRCAAALARHCWVSVSSVLVRRDVWLAAQREEDLDEFGMDWDFFLSIARDHPLGFLPEPLTSYRRSALSVSQHAWRKNPHNMAAMERILRRGTWRGIVTRAAFIDIMTEHYADNAETHRHAGHPRRAAWFCLRGLRHRPGSPLLWKGLARAAVRAAIPAGRS